MPRIIGVDPNYDCLLDPQMQRPTGFCEKCGREIYRFGECLCEKCREVLNE